MGRWLTATTVTQDVRRRRQHHHHDDAPRRHDDDRDGGARRHGHDEDADRSRGEAAEAGDGDAEAQPPPRRPSPTSRGTGCSSACPSSRATPATPARPRGGSCSSRYYLKPIEGDKTPESPYQQWATRLARHPARRLRRRRTGGTGCSTRTRTTSSHRARATRGSRCRALSSPRRRGRSRSETRVTQNEPARSQASGVRATEATAVSSRAASRRSTAACSIASRRQSTGKDRRSWLALQRAVREAKPSFIVPRDRLLPRRQPAAVSARTRGARRIYSIDNRDRGRAPRGELDARPCGEGLREVAPEAMDKLVCLDGDARDLPRRRRRRRRQTSASSTAGTRARRWSATSPSACGVCARDAVIYFHDAGATRSGIASCLRRLRRAGPALRRLQTPGGHVRRGASGLRPSAIRSPREGDGCGGRRRAVAADGAILTSWRVGTCRQASGRCWRGLATDGGRRRAGAEVGTGQRLSSTGAGKA